MGETTGATQQFTEPLGTPPSALIGAIYDNGLTGDEAAVLRACDIADSLHQLISLVPDVSGEDFHAAARGLAGGETTVRQSGIGTLALEIYRRDRQYAQTLAENQ